MFELFLPLQQQQTLINSGQIGDVKYSTLTEAQFQAEADSSWILCDGRSVSGSEYHLITGNVNIPDARGQFLRGENNGRNDGQENPDATPLATAQNQATAKNGLVASATAVGNHQHGDAVGYCGYNGSFGSGTTGSPLGCTSSFRDLTSTQGDHSHSISMVGGGNETRPTSVTVNCFVKINS